MYQNNAVNRNESWIKRQWRKTKEFCAEVKRGLEEHPELVAQLIPMLLAGGTTVVNIGTGIARERRLTKEANEKDSKVWDPETGITYELKRPMSSKQKVEYARLLKNRSAGETRADILDEMRLLK